MTTLLFFGDSLMLIGGIGMIYTVYKYCCISERIKNDLDPW